MINLSKRLELISNLINEKDTVLDIGCDHALLDIYLSQKYNKLYYASDLKENRLNNAKENIKKYKCSNVKLLIGNGLEVLDSCPIVDTLVLSGMGYLTIINILKNIKKLYKIENVIIESNSNPEKVRKYMIKSGFIIDKEMLVFENNFYYVVTRYKRGTKKYKNIDIELGIMELYTDKKLYKNYLEVEEKKNKILLNIIPKKYIFKRFEIKSRIKKIQLKRNSI